MYAELKKRAAPADPPGGLALLAAQQDRMVPRLAALLDHGDAGPRVVGVGGQDLPEVGFVDVARVRAATISVEPTR